MGVAWEDPPAVRSSQGTWSKIITELAQRPGQWARVDRTISTRAGCSNLRQRHPECEWTWEPNDQGTLTIWARYKAP